MIDMRVLTPGFMIGSSLYPVGSVISVNAPVRDYLLREKTAELVEDDAVPAKAYARRDMSAEPVPVKRKRGRPRKVKPPVEDHVGA